MNTIDWNNYWRLIDRGYSHAEALRWMRAIN